MADFDQQDTFSIAPELYSMPPGIEWLRIACERIFVDAIPAQHQGLQESLAIFPTDLIVGDDMLFGVLPMRLGCRAIRPHRSLRHADPALGARGWRTDLSRAATPSNARRRRPTIL
ncbi:MULTISPECIES: hypothetical protein [unclassified Bradyrhizobium]|uniref:hypothetical protein n=1 Tax=unclassified Bradyrhizobium TaxID=2631580 RepID=UPI0028EBF9EF|nr:MULTISPECIES: hypothetical protein [unclassified Bradyrhizobium]